MARPAAAHGNFNGEALKEALIESILDSSERAR